MALSCIVIYAWMVNHQKIVESRKQKVELTGRFSSQQFQAAIRDNITSLKNLKARIEETNGDYFEFWKFDAGLIVSQAPSIKFIEWIDSSMVIRMVTPEQENKAVIGLDISGIDYRNSDWLATKSDSLINVTHWLELTQNGYAFLIDAPLYYNGEFHGTITAGMNFEQQFDEIMLGMESYHVEVKDERGSIFYESGDSEGVSRYNGYTYEAEIPIEGGEQKKWSFSLTPNKNFFEANVLFTDRIDLIMGLLLSVLISMALYFMWKSTASQKSYKESNEKLRSLIESSPIAIYVINPEGKVVDFWNKAAEDMLGWKKEEVLGNFLPHVSEYKNEFQALKQGVLAGNQIKDKELIRTRKDGSKIHIRLNVGHLVVSDGRVNQMIALMEDITAEKAIQQQLENSLHEKEVLLTEVHHRVKNNLAIITGLIELQADEIRNKELKNILKETQNRIYSIAGVHEMLYKAASFTDISFEEYAENLIRRIHFMFESEEKEIKINPDLNIKNFNINQAIPLGLMLNELVTNSYKHAFQNKKEGNIWVSIKQEGLQIRVVYRDDGPGFDLEKFEQSNTLGLTLIKTLLQQLDAQYELDMSHGYKLDFHFRAKMKGAHSNMD